MVTAVPIRPPPPQVSATIAVHPSKMRPTPAATHAAVARRPSKRTFDLDESISTDATYSPAKRRSPPSDDDLDSDSDDADEQDDSSSDSDSEADAPISSSPVTSSTTPKPLRSALANRGPPSGSLAAFTAMRSGGDYRQGMYLAFVKNALQEKAQGNLGPYEELATQFNVSAPTLRASPAQLRSWMAALSHVVSALDRTHSRLVDSILHLPWFLLEDSFAHLWIKLVCSLVSARGEWLDSVLGRAVWGLGHISNSQARDLLGLPPSEFPDINRRQIYDRFHLMLRSLLALVPTLPSSLAPLLISHFPPKSGRRSEQLVYVRNILRVATYCNELSESILNLVINRAIQLDVEIQVELDDLEEDVLGQEDLVDPFDNVSDDDDSDADSDDGDLQDLMDDGEESADEDELDAGDMLDPDDQKAVERIRSLVSTLDCIMTALLEHLSRLSRGYQAAIDGQLSVAGNGATGRTAAVSMSPADGETFRRHLFHTLLGIFTRAMLPTFKCRHVQFLLFWFNSLDAEYSDLFLGVLLTKSLYGGINSHNPDEVEEPDIIRSAAASYVASFVSRASYVNGQTSRIVVLNLCAFLDAHLEASNQIETEIGSAPPGNRVHSVFYAVAQAVFYIFCFRWRELKLTADEQAEEAGDNDGDDLADGLHGSIGALSQVAAGQWCDGLNVVQRAITSPLNPLKFCSANVVKQFARIAQHTGFLYCYSIIESNNRSGRAVRSRQPSRTASQNTLDSLAAGGDPSSREGSDVGTPRPSDTNASQSQQQQQLPEPIQTSANLDVFFPFDPYKLQTSASFVDPLYREWADVAPEEDDDSEEDESDEEADEEEGVASADGLDAEPRRRGVDIPGAAHLSATANGQGGGGGDEFDSESFASQVEAMSISPYRG